MKEGVKCWLAVCVALTILAGCQDAGPAGRHGAGFLRVATYNVQWFSEDANPKRIEHLRQVLEDMAPDVIGFQEIESKKALAQVLGSNWEVGMLDEPDEAQELAIAVRRPLVLVSTEALFPGPQFEAFFPGRRDVLRAVVQTAEGGQLVVYVVHMKSRRGGRLTTDPQRIGACSLLAAYVRSQADEPDTVVLGDFNDAPDDQSVNILESGNLKARGGASRDDALLQNLTEPLADQDYVTEGVYRLYGGGAFKPVARGAKADNARLRGRDYDYPADVRVEQAFFDQILARPGLAQRCLGVRVFSSAAALDGSPGKTVVVDGRPDYVEKGGLASDHLPVYADLRLPLGP